MGSDLLNFPTVNNSQRLRTHISLIKKSELFFKTKSEWQGLLGLAYPKISRPDSSILSYLDTFKANIEEQCLAFSLELCGIIKNNSHFGNFRIMSKYKGCVSVTVKHLPAIPGFWRTCITEI